MAKTIAAKAAATKRTKKLARAKSGASDPGGGTAKAKRLAKLAKAKASAAAASSAANFYTAAEEIRCERLVEKKLSKTYEQEVINTATGKTTALGVKGYIIEHGLRKQITSTNYLASEFWTTFHQEFELARDKFAKMEQVVCICRPPHMQSKG